MPRLYQTEWCPASHRVRQRLTELGLTFVAVQVPVEKEERHELVAVAGVASVPVLVAPDGGVYTDEQAILDFLDSAYSEPPGASTHRQRAEQVQLFPNEARAA